jgi:hypothetical protein
MERADLILAKLGCRFARELDRALAARRKRKLAPDNVRRPRRGDPLPNLLLEELRIDMKFLKGLADRAHIFEETQEEVLDADVSGTEALRFVARQGQALAGPLGELFQHRGYSVSRERS